jgi:tetratricopeptide (TPR) repeat protein
MKALEKDRGRRYESAAALADDVQRFLNHEPVAAGPPTLRYRAARFVRRNRGAVTAAAFVLVALFIGIVGTTWGLFEARRQRDAADRALHLEAEARGKAEANLAYAKKGNEILGSVFAGLDPEKIAESGRPLQDVLRDNLRTAVRELEGSAVGDPLTVAEMQDTLALSMRGLGEYEPATALLEKATDTRAARLGPGHRATLASRNNLAEVHRAAGRLDKAVPLFERTLAAMRAGLGPDDPATLDCMSNLGLAYQDAGRAEESVSLLEQALALRKVKLGPDDPATLVTMNNLAGGELDLGRIDQAVPLYEQTLALRKTKLGLDHPQTLDSMNNLACAYKTAGRVSEAIALWEQDLRLTKAKLGHDHPDSLAAMNNLAGGYRDAGRPAEAIPIHEEALRLMRLKLGPDHPDTLRVLGNLGGDYLMATRFDKAVAIFEESLALREAKLGPDHPDVLLAKSHLAQTYLGGGKLEKAIPLFERVIPMLEKKLGRPHFTTQAVVANLGISYIQSGRPTDAIPLLQEAYAAVRNYPTLRWVGPYLLEAYAQTGKRDETARVIPEIVAEARRTHAQGSPELSASLAQYGLVLLRLKMFADAEGLSREALAIREKTQPEAWVTFNTMSQLGGALLGRKRYADAEPLLLRGYEGLDRRKSAIPPEARDRLPEAIDRLVELYESTGRPDDVKKWKAERSKL